MKNLLTLAAVLSLAGCSSTLETSTYSKETIEKKLPTGTPIAIPKSSLQVTISYTLTQCKVVTKTAPDSKETITAPFITYETEVAVVPMLHPAKYVYIDPIKASKFNNTLTVEAVYHPNGMTKSLDIKGSDKTIDITKSAVKSIVDISLATQGIPIIPSSGAAGQKEKFTCKYSDVKTAPKITELSIVTFDELANKGGYKIAIKDEKFKQWVELLKGGEPQPIQNIPLDLPTIQERTLSIHLKSLIEGKTTKDLAAQYNAQLKLLTGDKTRKGLPISVPGLGHLTVKNGHGEILESTLSQHPELGHLTVLNYETKIGKENSFVYSTTDSGQLNEIKYLEINNTVAEGITDVSKSVTTYKASKAKQEKLDEEERKTAEAKLVTAKVLAISLSHEAKLKYSDIDIAERIEILTPALVKIDVSVLLQLDAIKGLNISSKSNEELRKALGYLL